LQKNTSEFAVPLPSKKNTMHPSRYMFLTRYNRVPFSWLSLEKNMSNDDRKCVIPPFFLENAINKFDESRTCVIPSTLALQ